MNDRLPPRRFRFVMHEGKPIVLAKVALAQHFTRYFGDGEEGEIYITRVQRESTDQQRRFYRGVVVPIIAEWMGEPDLDAVHEAVAFKFLRLENHPLTGTPRRQSTSRKDMTVEQFRDFLDRVIAWATVDCGLLFPEPEKDPANRKAVA